MRTQILFNAQSTTRANDNTMTIFTSAEGAAGSKVSIFKSALLSALTVKQDQVIAGSVMITRCRVGNLTGFMGK